MSFLSSKSFIFNGINSEDFNVVIAWIDQDEPDVGSNGLTREVKKSGTNKRKIKDNIYGTENTESIIFRIGLVRIDGTEITRDESMKINTWLTSSPLPQLLKFNDADSCMLHYYAVCTEIKDTLVGSRLVGKELVFTTNSCFAFMQTFEKLFSITGEQNFYLNNLADTYDGIYYPTITITTQAQNIVIENITDKKSVTIDMIKIVADSMGNKTIVLNCSDMIVLDGNNKLIPISNLGWGEDYKSYVSTTNEYMNNIYWFRLLQGMNEIKVTGDCTFKIECEYPRKAGCL